MGLKNIIRKWLDIPESMKPIPPLELPAPPKTEITIEAPSVTEKDVEAAVALASVLAVGKPQDFRPTPVGRTEVSAREVRIIDPSDTTALLGSLKL